MSVAASQTSCIHIQNVCRCATGSSGRAVLPCHGAKQCCAAATHTWAAAILQGSQGELCVTVWGLCAAPQSVMLAVQLGEVTGSQNPGFSWLCCLLPVTKEKGVTKAGEMFHEGP